MQQNINAGNVKGPTGDPGPGVAAGGAAGQILAKASADDFDTEWVDKPEGEVTDVTVGGTSAVSGGVAALGSAAGNATEDFATAEQGEKADGAVQKQSGTTQTIDSNLALDMGNEILGIDNDRTQHVMMAHMTHVTAAEFAGSKTGYGVPYTWSEIQADQSLVSYVPQSKAIKTSDNVWLWYDSGWADFTPLTIVEQDEFGSGAQHFSANSKDRPTFDVTGLGHKFEVAELEDIEPITDVIPSTASASNKLVDEQAMNAAISQETARQLGYNAAGDAFPTKAALAAATQFYYQGSAVTPSTNDFVVVLADESAPAPFTGGQTRYRYDGTAFIWAYGINESPFTTTQQAAIDSGITAAKVDKYEGYDTGKADKAATLAGYGITDAYTKTESNTNFATAAQGTKADTALQPSPSVGNVPANQFVKLGTADLTLTAGRCAFGIKAFMQTSGSNGQSCIEGILSLNYAVASGALTNCLASMSVQNGTYTVKNGTTKVWSALSLIITTAGDIYIQNLGNAALYFEITKLWTAGVTVPATFAVSTALTDPVYHQCWGGGSNSLDGNEKLTGRLFNEQPTYIKTYTGAHGIDDDNIVAIKDTGANMWVEYTKTPLLTALEFTVDGNLIQIDLSSADASGTPSPSDFTLSGGLAGKTITAVDISLGSINLTLDTPCDYNTIGSIAYAKGANLITTPLGATLQNIGATLVWNATAPATAPLVLGTAQGEAYLMAEDVYGGFDIYMFALNKGSGAWANRITASRAYTPTGISDGRVLANNGDITGRTQCSIEGNLTPQVETGRSWIISRYEAVGAGSEQGVQYNWFNHPTNDMRYRATRVRGFRGIGNIWIGTSLTGTTHYYYNQDGTAVTGGGGSCGMVPCFAVVHQ